MRLCASRGTQQKRKKNQGCGLLRSRAFEMLCVPHILRGMRQNSDTVQINV